MDFRINLPLMYNSDSYKGTHFLGFPAGTSFVYGAYEARAGSKYDEIPLLGLQAFIKNYLSVKITKEEVDKAEIFWMKHVGVFNREGWDTIVNEYDGFIPVTIYALPEGTITKPGIPSVTYECPNDRRLMWLPTFIDTALIRALWYPSAVGARIRKIRKEIKTYFDLSSDTYDALPFALLDFSSRGTSSLESSMIGGYAYLTQFMGSDNVPAVVYTNELFNSEMSGYSVRATEHSCMMCYDDEKESFRSLLKNMGASGAILSVVSDTWDIYKAVDLWCELAEEVKASGVQLVVRPDSGKFWEQLPVIFSKLDVGFGVTINKKGFKVLNSVKVLWGDGVDENSVGRIFKLVTALGYSADCILTGSGGGLMQVDINRDSIAAAAKASVVTINGEDRFVSKQPKTDLGKASKKGFFSVYRNDAGELYCAPEESEDREDLLELTYANGTTFTEYDLEEVRARAQA